jgi:hypothetical protein
MFTDTKNFFESTSIIITQSTKNIKAYRNRFEDLIKDEENSIFNQKSLQILKYIA